MTTENEMEVTVDSSNTQLPDDDESNSEVRRYFAETARDKPSDVQIREIASILDDDVVGHSFHDSDYFEIGYAVGFVEVTATGTDEESCDERCKSEVLKIFKTWCGYSDSALKDDGDVKCHGDVKCDGKESIEAESTIDRQNDSISDECPKPSTGQLTERDEAGTAEDENDEKVENDENDENDEKVENSAMTKETEETNKIDVDGADRTKPAAGKRTAFSRFKRWAGKRMRAIVCCGPR